MLDYLNHIDQSWLLAINGWHSEWADMLMWHISRSATWIPLYVLLVGMLAYKFLRQHQWARLLITLLAFAMAVGLADYISSGIIKPLVCRLRPTHDPDIAHLIHLVRDYQGGMYGFVSSHAANTAAVALLFSLVWRDVCSRARYAVPVLLALWCAANCYSRMYLGVHYPGDILGGLLVGSLCSCAVYSLLRGVDRALPACS